MPTDAYDAVRSDIERTRQRVVIGRWSDRLISRLATFAIAAAAVLIIGAVGLTTIGSPGSPGAIGPSQQVGQVWSGTNDVAFTIRRDTTDDGDHYWRAVTYDRLDLRGYSSSAMTIVDRPAGTRILDGRADDARDIGVRSVTFTVIPGSLSGSTIVSPATPIKVDQATRVSTVGTGGYFVALDRVAGSGAYTVTALVPIVGDGEAQINRATLLAAGTDYPAEIRSLYTTLPAGMWGPNLEILKEKVMAASPTREPIDIAQALEQELRSSAYLYSTDIRDVDCGKMSTAECFAKVKRGFCEWYAQTMAVVLRDLGIRRGSLRASCPDLEISRPRSRSSGTTTPTPGSRSISLATAGSPSTRPRATCPASCRPRCRPGRRSGLRRRDFEDREPKRLDAAHTL